MLPHTVLHRETLMLLRLIISQVCHLIFIWASEVLTSVSVPLFCHLSAFFFILFPFHFCLIIFFVLSLTVFLPLYPTLLRQGFYRLCSVSDPMKNCQRLEGEKEVLCCIKIIQKQRYGFVSGSCCKFYLYKMVSYSNLSDVLANKKVWEL